MEIVVNIILIRKVSDKRDCANAIRWGVDGIQESPSAEWRSKQGNLTSVISVSKKSLWMRALLFVPIPETIATNHKA